MLKSTSELRGVIGNLRYGAPLFSEQVDEIERLLGELQKAGWSGLIPADEAVRSLRLAAARKRRSR